MPLAYQQTLGSGQDKRSVGVYKDDAGMFHIRFARYEGSALIVTQFKLSPEAADALFMGLHFYGLNAPDIIPMTIECPEMVVTPGNPLADGSGTLGWVIKPTDPSTKETP